MSGVGQNEGMKRTLLFVLALIAVGCADVEQSGTTSDGSGEVAPSALSLMSYSDHGPRLGRMTLWVTY